MTDFTSVDDTRFGIKSAQRKAQLPWTLVAKGATKTLRQICGVRPSGLRMLESTLKDVPMREGEEFPSLPCVAFSCSGICSVSQSFLDFAGESLEKVLGSDLRRAPLHWVLPMETNKWLNLEAWVPLEKLHKSAFAGASRLRQQNRVQANEEEEEATTSITTSVSSSQSMFLEERTPVTVSLLLSPGREGKVFWNLVRGFRTEIKKELLVIHVLMPIAVDVPSSFWTSQTGATTPTNGPIPELTPYVDGILQRLRSKLGKMQAQEAKQVKGVEDHFHTEEVPLPPSPARRRASDLGPMGQTQPNLPTKLLRVAMTRRISEVSLCSSLPELFELWDAGASSAMRCRALEATELRCRELARALSDVWSGIHFVPRFGSAMALPYELYYFWEEVLANESQVLMSHWKYGKKGDRSHRRELFNIEPYMILDPDETDCPIAYMSQGLEDLFGYWRAWALGRNFRFLMLPDALPNRVFNGQEFSRIEDFCCNQGQKEQGSADAASHMMSLLRLYSVKSKQPIWCCLYLRHVWLQDPTVFESQFDFSAKHFILAVCLPLYTQMPALRDLLNNDMLETNMQLTARLRIMLMERTQNVEFCEKEAHAILNSLIPAWLLECGRGVPTCMVGQHFVPRLGLAPLKDFQGLWPHLVRLLFRLKNPPSEEMFQPTLHDQEQGLACWVVDVRSKDLPLVFISQALQRLSGFDADFALARNVQLFQPKKQRIDQAINNEESARLQEFSEKNRTHGDVMASLLLLERRNGQRFFVVQQTFYLKEPRSDRSYLLSVLHPIETPMPAVLKSHQITELSEDEMGMALEQQKRLKGLLARHEGGAKFISLEAVQRQLLSVFFADFPMLLQAPSVRSPNGLEIPIFGLEVSANNTQVSGALKAGVRHVHILLPSGPTTRASDGSTFVRKILPLKLAEVLNNLQQQHLHYLREAMVITVRTPPHLVFVLAEVRKTLATAGYSVACWFLDVRGCTPADVGDHWQAISQAKAPSEAVGIFGGNQRLLQAIHRRGAFVSICAVKVHPGKRPDEPEMRLMSKLACNGTLPMAYGIFGPQNSWLQSSQAQSAAGRLNIAPSTLALKWAEYKGFLALVPDLQDLFASEVPVEHRSFMRLYRAAPSVEICSSVLWGTTGVIPEVLTTPRARVASPKLCRSKDFQQLIPGLCPGATPKAPKKEAQAVKQQILPDLVKRAHQGRPGLVWHGEVASKRLQVEASPRAAGGNHDSEEMVEADYNLPWPSEMEDLDDLLGSSAPEALKPIRRPRPQPPLRRKRPREVLIVSVGEDKVVPEETDEAACGYKSLFVSLGMK